MRDQNYETTKQATLILTIFYIFLLSMLVVKGVFDTSRLQEIIETRSNCDIEKIDEW